MNNFIVRSLLVVATASAILQAGCNVDSDYDLSNIESDSLGLGTDESVFDIPLAKVTLNAADFLINDELSSYGILADSKVTSMSSDITDAFVTDHWDAGIMGLIYQINSILPTELSGEYADGIDLSRFDDAAYVSDLVGIVVDEYANDEAKILDFCEMMIARAPNYPDQVEMISDIFDIDFDDVTLSAADCAATLMDALNDEDMQEEYIAAFAEDILPGIMAVLVEYAKISIEESVASIALDESVYDLIGGNLDGDKNYLQIGAAITTDLPFSVSFDSSLLYVEDGSEKSIAITSVTDYSGDKGVIESVDVLRAIMESVTIKADVSLDKYTPASDLTLDDKSVVVTLMARKSGSIKF